MTDIIKTRDSLNRLHRELKPGVYAEVMSDAGNITGKIRDAFEVYNPSAPGSRWSQMLGSGDLVYVDGNAAAASYLVISKNPLVAGQQTDIESTFTFSMPIELAVGLSMSQRTLGQEFAVEVVDTGGPLPDRADLAINVITQATTTLTVDTVLPHGLSVGTSIGIRDCANHLANYPALVVATVLSPTQFTCTAGPGGTITSQTITNPAGAKGFVFFRERLGRAQNGLSEIFENATATNASLYIRSESGDVLPSGTVAGSQSVTIGTTASIQLAGAAAYQYSFSPTSEYRMLMQADRTQWADSAVDAVAASTSRGLRTQVCPDPTETYKLRFRAVNAKSLTVPSAQIVSAVKSASTTGTITTATPHGLVTGDPVVIYGIRAQGAAEFPNITTATAVTVVNDTQFTLTIGTSGTVTSYGGYVAKVQGGNLMSALGAAAMAIQSASMQTLADGTRQLALAISATTGFAVGDLVNIVGVRDNTTGATLNLDGAWKIGNASAASLWLVPPTSSYTPPAPYPADTLGTTITSASNNQTLPQATINVASTTGYPASGTFWVNTNAGFQLITYTGTTGTTFTGCTGGTGLLLTGQAVNGVTLCGGGVIRRTDLRVSFVRLFDYERQRVEMLARPTGDISAAAPVSIQNTPAVTVSSGTVTTVSTVTSVTAVASVTSSQSAIPGIIADVASAALTSSATTSALTPTFGTAYSVSIPVTAVSGTPTLDVSIEESDDTGTNWFKVYDFPRITATGMYRSPLIRLIGNRVRYVQTVGGGSPSVTRAINRLQSSSEGDAVRQLIDRTIVLTTLNSTTPSLDCRDAGNRAQLVVNVGAITTTAPQLQMEGSDDNGASWYLVGTPLTAVASSTVQLTVNDINAALMRVRVSTAGSGVTAGYVMLKAHD
jgi:hypothetical protein